ncbi:MAG: YeeE/YedE family protein [Gemmatimonadales bacterium]|nr:YeeE/YedE family protein [Gemmatimonadales bacterium]
MTTDSQQPSAYQPSEVGERRGPGLPLYFVLGCLFGIVIIKSEAVSWFRIQEMFRFQSFHMYGIMGSAFVTASLSIAILKRAGARTLAGETIAIPPKSLRKGYRYWIGGTLFGFGWALTGACPGPMFALTGSGLGVYAVAALSALAGAWLYGYLRPRLPH